MRRIPKLTNKKVIIPEEDEEEKVRKTEAKKAMIRAEFEKHKKELKLNVSDASKINEIRLKNQLEELLTANTRKKKDLDSLQNTEENLEKNNNAATLFSHTVDKFYTTKGNNSCLSVGFHPNRTTSTMFGMKEDRTAEVLGEKKAELMETLDNINLLIEQEGEIGGSVDEMLHELKKNQILLSKKVNEIKKMNEHADKRFTDLKRVEFLARNKQAASAGDLKEMKDNLKELKNQESSYKKQKEEDKKREAEYILSRQSEMSNVLIELDQKKLEFEQNQRELKKHQIQYEEMRDKRKTTCVVTKYIETFNALEGKSTNLVEAHQALKEMLDNSRDSSPLKRSPSIKDRNSPSQVERGEKVEKKTTPTGSFRDVLAQRLVKPDEPNRVSPVRRNSVIDRNYYIEKIQDFYETHPEGPHELVDRLIGQYLDHCYREKSLKGNYEELQKQKRKQEGELQVLQRDLSILEEKNEYITMGSTGSKILESNEQEAIDSGMLVVNDVQMTLNQAKFEFENRKETDNSVILLGKTEAFVLRCYLDSVEMMSRISKILFSIFNQSGGMMIDELRDMSKYIYAQVTQLKRPKRGNKESPFMQNFSEAPAQDLHRTQTDTTNSDKEREQEVISTLDLQEVHETFLSVFDGFSNRASEFVSHVKNDVMIFSFITIDNIKTFLQAYQTDLLIENQVERAILEIDNLRNVAMENMIQKFSIVYKMYADFTSLTDQIANEACLYLEEKGQNAKIEDMLKRGNAEQTGFVKKALQKKWQNLIDKYDYDPARDFRVETIEIDSFDKNEAVNKNLNTEEIEENAEKDIWDSDDVKAKINEIVGVGFKRSKTDQNGAKTMYNGKSEEDQKRLQAKKEKEKQKLAIDNMTEEEFLNFQRSQIKEIKEDYFVTETNEGQLLRKAQADQALRLSQTVPLDELKKMIQNSKVLSKIQILEKHKGITAGKKNFKQNTIDNYIPAEPIKVPKSSVYTGTSNADWKVRITRNAFTPNSAVHNRLFASSSERMTETEYDESPKETSFKLPTRTASKFKPNDSPFGFTSEPTFDTEKPFTQGAKRINTFESFKKTEKYEDQKGDFKGNKMPLLTEHGTEDIKKRNKLLISTMQKRHGNSEPQSTKSKNSVGLPKLDKPIKSKSDLKKKKKNKNKNKLKNEDDRSKTEQDNLNILLNLQTDPTLKMVYSPSFFVPNLFNVGPMDDMDYKFDAFKFKVPSMLVSEKI